MIGTTDPMYGHSATEPLILGILKLVAKRSCMLIVTHDEDQMKRIGTYEYELKTT